jgi:polyhydroxybutyrate depolymerase
VRIFVPSSYADGPLPVVLNWHGLGSNGTEQALFTGYEALAESEGFIVVHPTGVPAPGDTRNSWELADEQDPGRDDIAFANALIDHLITDWCADPARVYSTGMSNGGFFTARLLCQVADRIAAASSVAGTYHPDGCAPARPVPYLAFHGTNDLVVPFDGSGESILLTGDDPVLRAFFQQVMPDEFAEFAADAGCSIDPTKTDVGDDVIAYDYTGCGGGVPMAFFEVTGGGHTWPGSPLADQVAGALGYTTDDVDATAASWAFFEQHSLEG